jgi:hypothetical protein
MLPGYPNDTFSVIHGADFINNTEEQLDYKLDQLDKNQLILFNYCSEHYGPHDDLLRMYDYFVKHNLNFILLYHDNKINYEKSNILFYPYWYYQSITDFPQLYKKNISDIEKKFKISCLNGNHRFHRIYNFFKLKEKHYFDEILFTINYDTKSTSQRLDDYHLVKEILNQWDEFKHNAIDFMQTRLIRQGATLKLYSNHDTTIDSPAYQNSYVNLVTETTVISRIFVTEKTWKPIASGQLFLIIGAPGIIQHLRGLGVDTFDDIINHDYYDLELDWEQRILKVHKILEDLIDQDLYQLNTLTQDRRLRNAEKFYAGEFGSKYTTCLQNKINELSIR